MLDWIVSQPWSDGRVAAVGISYGGTAALLLAARGHPALRAVAARFCSWDLADDLVLPGGVRNAWLGERWDHGGYHDVSPWNVSGELRFDIGGEVLHFLDRAFERPGAEAVAPVRYHVIGEERWRAAPAWPPAESTTLALQLDSGGALTPGPAADGADGHVLDLSASTGELTRWRGQLQPAPPTAYAGDGRAGPAHVSPPLPDGLEIAGEPACVLRLEAGAERAHVFVYLDEIRPDGSAVYITEGCAAVSGPWPATARVELLPIAYRIDPGSALRVSLAAVDGEVFERPPRGAERIRPHRGGPEPSRIELRVARPA